jgi:hypothetical protein
MIPEVRARIKPSPDRRRDAFDNPAKMACRAGSFLGEIPETTAQGDGDALNQVAPGFNLHFR